MNKYKKLINTKDIDMKRGKYGQRRAFRERQAEREKKIERERKDVQGKRESIQQSIRERECVCVFLCEREREAKREAGKQVRREGINNHQTLLERHCKGGRDGKRECVSVGDV